MGQQGRGQQRGRRARDAVIAARDGSSCSYAQTSLRLSLIGQHEGSHPYTAYASICQGGGQQPKADAGLDLAYPDGNTA